MDGTGPDELSYFWSAMETATMAFCVKCGQAVGDRDAFCGTCGATQPGVPRSSPVGELAPANAAALCYIPVLGFIMSIVVLASEKYRGDMVARFHAFQGLFLAVTFQIVDKVYGPFVRFPSEGLLKFALIGLGIWLIIATARGEKIKLPFLGDLAEKAAEEQR